MDERPKNRGVPVLAGTAMGALFALACLSTLLLQKAGISRQSLYMTFVAGIFAMPLGSFVGLLCQPIVGHLLARKRTSLAVTILVLLVTPFVIVATLFRFHMQFLPIPVVFVCSCAAFYVLCAGLIRFVLPDCRDEPSCCRSCGYDLRGSVDAGRCPECGHLFKPDRPPVGLRRDA